MIYNGEYYEGQNALGYLEGDKVVIDNTEQISTMTYLKLTK